jgi:predicted ATPase
MSEKLIIRNFGPIKDVEINLRRVNILIGDQGTGKSTVAKMLSILKNAIHNIAGETFISINGQVVEERNNIVKYQSKQFKEYFSEALEKSEIKTYFRPDTFISFENSSCRVTIESDDFEFVDKERREGKNTDLNYYIPAYREAYILLRNNYPAILNAKATLPNILNSFGQLFNNYREELKKFNFKSIIGVEYSYINGNEFIILENGKKISFEEASSAVNSVVPMLVVFSGIVNYMAQENGRIYYRHNCPLITIEEPELNSFPLTQKKIVEFLIENVKFKNYVTSNEFYCNLLISTHSPYILTSLNNIMYAYQVGQNHESETNKIIDKKYWINPKDVSAYMLLSEGTCEDIFDNEENLIKAEKIDSVSGILNEQFDALLNIELVKK